LLKSKDVVAMSVGIRVIADVIVNRVLLLVILAILAVPSPVLLHALLVPWVLRVLLEDRVQPAQRVLLVLQLILEPQVLLV
jgi:hypothetical protein